MYFHAVNVHEVKLSMREFLLASIYTHNFTHKTCTFIVAWLKDRSMLIACKRLFLCTPYAQVLKFLNLLEA